MELSMIANAASLVKSNGFKAPAQAEDGEKSLQRNDEETARIEAAKKEATGKTLLEVA